MFKEKLLTLWQSKTIQPRSYVAIVLAVVGLMLLGYGLIASFQKQSDTEDITFESGNQEVSKAKIVIDIEGAVVYPGVYTLESDARIKDALISASGLSSDADRDWVSKNLNLASKLNDGSKIYIPRVGDPTVVSGQISPIGQTGLININSASLSELDSLPDIGSARAQKIIDNRPYASIEDLTSKKVVTSKIFEKIKDKISVY